MKSAVRTTLQGRQVELVCIKCAFTIRLPVRDALPLACPKCRAKWALSAPLPGWRRYRCRAQACGYIFETLCWAVAPDCCTVCGQPWQAVSENGRRGVDQPLTTERRLRPSPEPPSVFPCLSREFRVGRAGVEPATR
jgi:hypothetical protein